MRLGKVQRAMLQSLQKHGEWWHGAHWMWDTPSNTLRVMNGLVKRGSATRDSEGVYTITYQGKVEIGIEGGQ